MIVQKTDYAKHADLLSKKQILDAVTPFLYPAKKVPDTFVSAKVKGMDDIVISFFLNIGGNYTPLLKSTQQAYGITAKEIFDHISHTDYGYTLSPIMDILKELNLSEALAISDDDTHSLFYVLTNNTYSYGAAAIANPVVLQKLREKFKCSLYIFPSSVHEVLLIPVQNIPNAVPNELADMVKEINHNVVGPEEFLSDHVYLYDYEQNCIRTLA